jgi:ABC-type polysaccharide/polyol phosphate transport system ATPase subunit
MAGTRVVCSDLWVGYRAKSRRGLPRFGQTKWGLRGIDLEVAPGELVGVMGGNGSGKTTLLRTIAGVFRPSKGRVQVGGKVGALVELRPDADRDLAARERILMSGVLLGFRRHDKPYLEEVVSDFGELDAAVLDAPVYTLSTGMLLRLEMSLLLHAGCDVLAVDELLVAADAEFRRRCLERIGEVCSRGGAAILSSHDPSLLTGCDRVLRLESGQFVQETMLSGDGSGLSGDGSGRGVPGTYDSTSGTDKGVAGTYDPTSASTYHGTSGTFARTARSSATPDGPSSTLERASSSSNGGPGTLTHRRRRSPGDRPLGRGDTD